MGRGKSFNHKRKGHANKVSKIGAQVPSKHTEDVEYSIEPVASENRKPVTIVEKD